MDTNIIIEYINFIKRKITDFYKIVLGSEFDKTLVEPFINKYIIVRYYNETIFSEEKDLIDRISKEMETLLKKIMNPENEEKVKNIYSMLGYVLYFDDCYFIVDDKSLLNMLFSDENIKIKFDLAMKEETKKFLNNFRNGKTKFNETISSKIFFINEKRLNGNYYKLDLNHNVKVSSLYSESMIKTAFNTGSVKEDKMLILLIMASNMILQNAIILNFSKYYVIDLDSSLFSKNKKIEKILHIADNILAQRHLMFNIKYKEYLSNKEIVDELIRRGFSFSVTIDNTFDGNYSVLVLFSCVLLYKDDEKYDMINNDKDRLSSRLIII